MSEGTRVREFFRARSVAEQHAYMAGQRMALKLAREKGLEYAEGIIAVAQDSIVAVRSECDKDSTTGRKHIVVENLKMDPAYGLADPIPDSKGSKSPDLP